eukprot:6038576-Amphidinium_carterae.1
MPYMYDYGAAVFNCSTIKVCHLHCMDHSLLWRETRRFNLSQMMRPTSYMSQVPSSLGTQLMFPQSSHRNNSDGSGISAVPIRSRYDVIAVLKRSLRV